MVCVAVWGAEMIQAGCSPGIAAFTPNAIGTRVAVDTFLATETAAGLVRRDMDSLA